MENISIPAKYPTFYFSPATLSRNKSGFYPMKPLQSLQITPKSKNLLNSKAKLSNKTLQILKRRFPHCPKNYEQKLLSKIDPLKTQNSYFPSLVITPNVKTINTMWSPIPVGSDLRIGCPNFINSFSEMKNKHFIKGRLLDTPENSKQNLLITIKKPKTAQKTNLLYYTNIMNTDQNTMNSFHNKSLTKISIESNKIKEITQNIQSSRNLSKNFLKSEKLEPIPNPLEANSFARKIRLFTPENLNCDRPESPVVVRAGIKIHLTDVKISNEYGTENNDDDPYIVDYTDGKKATVAVGDNKKLEQWF